MIDHPDNTVALPSSFVDFRFQKDSADEYALVFKKLFDNFIEENSVKGSL